MTATISEERAPVPPPPGPPGPPSGGHPLAEALSTVRSALSQVADTRCWSLPDQELAEAVDQAQLATSQLDELRLRLLTEASGRDPGVGFMATSTAAWLAARHRIDRREAAREVRLGRALDVHHERTRAALAAGRVNAEQVRVIVSALGRLPVEIDSETRDRAEAWLLEQGEMFGPEDLRRLGRRIYEVIDPDGAEAHEGRLLEAEEERARAKARMWMRPDGDGSTHGGFCIPDAQAEMLQTALNALLSPRRRTDGLANGAESPTVFTTPRDADLDGRRLPYEQRLGLALCELIEHLPLDKLPQAGRSTPGVVVEIDYQALLTGLGAGTLSSSGRVSASEARRLACNGGLLPMVLSGESVVLDLGRSERLFTRQQRIALGKVQGGCVADGCDRPPAWCEAHHCAPWTAGGRTELANGALLCGRHHHLVHLGGWAVEVADDGVPELVPPARVDPLRRPVRHRRLRLKQRE